MAGLLATHSSIVSDQLLLARRTRMLGCCTPACTALSSCLSVSVCVCGSHTLIGYAETAGAGKRSQGQANYDPLPCTSRMTGLCQIWVRSGCLERKPLSTECQADTADDGNRMPGCRRRTSTATMQPATPHDVSCTHWTTCTPNTHEHARASHRAAGLVKASTHTAATSARLMRWLPATPLSPWHVDIEMHLTAQRTASPERMHVEKFRVWDVGQPCPHTPAPGEAGSPTVCFKTQACFKSFVQLSRTCPTRMRDCWPASFVRPPGRTTQWSILACRTASSPANFASISPQRTLLRMMRISVQRLCGDTCVPMAKQCSG
eukprot:363017-Chlamydomonas_euryale.AAC.7